MAKEQFNNFVPVIIYHVFRKCSPDWQLRSHYVNDYDITYVIKGKARYTIDGKNYDVEQGDIICLTDSMEKEAVTNAKNPMHCFSVNFNSLYPAFKSCPPSFPVFSRIGLRKDIVDMFRELTISWSNQQDGYIVKTRALLMQILNRLSEILIFNIDSQTWDYRIIKATNFIALHYSEKLTVKELAALVHLNEAYFGRLFKQEIGMSVNQYIMKIRVRNAETMLQTGNFKVHEVAEYCGFSDVVYFFKSFKALRGFSPSRCIP